MLYGNILNHSKSPAGNAPELLQKTDKMQQQEIVKELKAIMAIYDNKDCNED